MSRLDPYILSFIGVALWITAINVLIEMKNLVTYLRSKRREDTVWSGWFWELRWAWREYNVGYFVRKNINEIFYAAIVVLLSIGIFRGAKKTYPFLIRVFTPNVARGIVAAVICAFGFIAHWYKQKDQLRYGQIEVIIGCLSAFAIARSMPSFDDYAKWSSLVGSAYIIARGMNNRSDARARAAVAVPVKTPDSDTLAAMIAAAIAKHERSSR